MVWSYNRSGIINTHFFGRPDLREYANITVPLIIFPPVLNLATYCLHYHWEYLRYSLLQDHHDILRQKRFDAKFALIKLNLCLLQQQIIVLLPVLSRSQVDTCIARNQIYCYPVQGQFPFKFYSIRAVHRMTRFTLFKWESTHFGAILSRAFIFCSNSKF